MASSAGGESSGIFTMRVRDLTIDESIFSNLAYISLEDFKKIGYHAETFKNKFSGKKILINRAEIDEKLVLNVMKASGIKQGEIAMNRVHRQFLNAEIGELVDVKSFVPPTPFKLALMSIELKNPSDGSTSTINAPSLVSSLKNTYKGQVMCEEQEVMFEFNTKQLSFTVLRTILAENEDATRGILSNKTQIFVRAFGDSHITITDQEVVPQRAFQTNIRFNLIESQLMSLGVGGLASNFREIITKAFAGRYLPSGLIQELGYKHVKGMILHGPPGTGKTLVARTMAKFFDAKIKVMNGPEVFGKYVGESEGNVRNLFTEAVADYMKEGEDSRLHFIVFDELDSIARKRGSKSEDTVADKVVNQLLTMIDGYGQLNNVFLIGTTNRIDLVDLALMRPGRLELKLRLGLPDRMGRLQILQIHSEKMRKRNLLDSELNLEEIASRTSRWSGAQLEGACRVAFSYAMARVANGGLSSLKIEDIKVLQSDFEQAVEDLNPAVEPSILEHLGRYSDGVMRELNTFNEVLKTTEHLLKCIKNKTPMITCLLCGPCGSGKTSLAAVVALEGNLKHVNLISLDTLSGLQEDQQCMEIHEVFENARSFLDCVIILDDVEWLVRYNEVESHCSSLILTALLEELKKIPPKGTSMLVIGTTSRKDVLKKIGFTDLFSVHIDVPSLQKDDTRKILEHFDVIRGKDLDIVVELLDNIPIKKIYQVIDMVCTGEREEVLSGRKKVEVSKFLTCIKYIDQNVMQKKDTENLIIVQRKEYEELQQDNTDCKNRNANLEGKVTSLQQEVETLREEVTKLRASVADPPSSSG